MVTKHTVTNITYTFRTSSTIFKTLEKWKTGATFDLFFFFYIAFDLRVRAMMLNATFNNISVISWQSVLLVEETGVPGVNHGQTVVSSTPRLLLNWPRLNNLLLSLTISLNIGFLVIYRLQENFLHASFHVLCT